MMLDVIMFLIFEKQNSVKMSQRKNYKNTAFYHTNFIQNYNWSFWKKHSCFMNMQSDLVSYNNNNNILFTTQKLIDNILLYNMWSFLYNNNIIIIKSPESSTISIEKLWPSSSFYEREVSELFGISFFKKNDSRNLLLDYGNLTSPMRKDYSLYGKTELRYTKFFDGPKNVNNSAYSI